MYSFIFYICLLLWLFNIRRWPQVIVLMLVTWSSNMYSIRHCLIMQWSENIAASLNNQQMTCSINDKIGLFCNDNQLIQTSQQRICEYIYNTKEKKVFYHFLKMIDTSSYALNASFRFPRIKISEWRCCIFISYITRILLIQYLTIQEYSYKSYLMVAS
jgi:hypothetical protein